MVTPNLKQLSRLLATQRARITALERRRDQYDAAIRRLIGGDGRAARRKAVVNGTAPRRGGLTAWLLSRDLPQPVAVLAAASKAAGFSGRPNAVAAAAAHDARLVRLPDGRIGKSTRTLQTRLASEKQRMAMPDASKGPPSKGARMLRWLHAHPSPVPTGKALGTRFGASEALGCAVLRAWRKGKA